VTSIAVRSEEAGFFIPQHGCRPMQESQNRRFEGALSTRLFSDSESMRPLIRSTRPSTSSRGKAFFQAAALWLSWVMNGPSAQPPATSALRSRSGPRRLTVGTAAINHFGSLRVARCASIGPEFRRGRCDRALVNQRVEFGRATVPRIATGSHRGTIPSQGSIGLLGHGSIRPIFLGQLEHDRTENQQGDQVRYGHHRVESVGYQPD